MSKWETYRSYLEGEPSWYPLLYALISGLPWAIGLYISVIAYLVYSWNEPMLLFATNAPLYVLLAVSCAIGWLALYGNEYHWRLTFDFHIQIPGILQMCAYSKPRFEEEDYIKFGYVCTMLAAQFYLVFYIYTHEFHDDYLDDLKWRWKYRPSMRNMYLAQPAVTMQVIESHPFLHLTNMQFFFAWRAAFIQHLAPLLAQHLPIIELVNIVLDDYETLVHE